MKAIESRWMAFFDAMGIKYEAREHDSVFWLLGQEYWIEIVEQEPTDQEIDKAIELSHMSGKRVYILSGDCVSRQSLFIEPTYKGYGFVNGVPMAGEHVWCMCTKCGKVGMKPVRPTLAQMDYLPCKCYLDLWDGPIDRLSTYLQGSAFFEGLEVNTEQLIAAYTANFVHGRTH